MSAWTLGRQKIWGFGDGEGVVARFVCVLPLQLWQLSVPSVLHPGEQFLLRCAELALWELEVAQSKEMLLLSFPHMFASCCSQPLKAEVLAVPGCCRI